MSMPGDSYPAPAPTVRFDVINQAWAMLQQQMGSWVVLTLVAVVIVGVANWILGKIPGLGALLGTIASAIVAAGLYRAALKHLRGETIAVGDMFGVTDMIGPIIVAAILTTIGTGIAAIFCVIPGLVLGALWMFSQLLIVDKGMDGVEAMRQSFNALRGQWPMATLFMFVVALVGLAGIVACGVGVLITAPLALLSVTILYRDFFPETSANPFGDAGL